MRLIGSFTLLTAPRLRNHVADLHQFVAPVRHLCQTDHGVSHAPPSGPDKARFKMPTAKPPNNTAGPASGAQSTGSSGTVSRQTINLRPRDLERLDRLMGYCDGNANDAVRMALGLADVVVTVMSQGGTVTVQDVHGKQQALKLIV